MSVQTFAPLLAEQEFFAGFDPSYLELLAGCATDMKFNAGQQIFHEGQTADHFYLVRHGKVAVEHLASGKGPVTIQLLEDGDVLGWSWLFPPYRWHYDARAVESTRAVAFDGTCLRRACEDDPKMGYKLMSRFAQVIMDRLYSARTQLMDLHRE